MTQRHRTLIYSVLNLPAGNLAITGLQFNQWGNLLIFDVLYRYPPDEKAFRLVFKDCRGLEWTVVKSDDQSKSQAQFLTHDLGEPHYRRPARIATVAFEAIISYDELVIEKNG